MLATITSMNSSTTPHRKCLVAAAVMTGCVLAGLNSVTAAAAPLPTVADTTVQGDGSNDSPYRAECSEPEGEDCIVYAFAPVNLPGLTFSKSVAAYQCPASHPWLTNQNYAPWGTTLPAGVEVLGLSKVSVSITGVSRDDEHIVDTPDGFDFALLGTRTGFVESSASNWNFEEYAYHVLLHCTRNFDHAKHHYTAQPLGGMSSSGSLG